MWPAGQYVGLGGLIPASTQSSATDLLYASGPVTLTLQGLCPHLSTGCSNTPISQETEAKFLNAWKVLCDPWIRATEVAGLIISLVAP